MYALLKTLSPCPESPYPMRARARQVEKRKDKNTKHPPNLAYQKQKQQVDSYLSKLNPIQQCNEHQNLHIEAHKKLMCRAMNPEL